MLDALLTEIADSGWLVSNLFQLNSGSWQANLRSATHHTGWGSGESPELALSLAIDLITSAIESDLPQPTCVSPYDPTFKDLSTIMNRSRPCTFSLRVKL